nr:immunoglobulin heavy chain junction region [Macaca mulatta]MOW99375.1 immunoglobulin heavy chain junction region [Macaca mulatta]MOW99376.1 immunoglobulin heavy chain junction region [Macaca mulatta]MOW99567.1 immunoglobulin heavy chain junction region [Macaca mulatta]MOW99922.1 immunoglobulin heavy chain junction region [Macaca mulatta]
CARGRGVWSASFDIW